MWSYISNTLPEAIFDGRYNVFVVKLYHVDGDKNDISFSISNIVNSVEFTDINANYYFNLGKEIVLVDVPDTTFINRLEGFDWKKLDNCSFNYDKNGTYIIQRLLARSDGYIMRHYVNAVMYTIRKCSIERQFDGDIYCLPESYAIFEKIDMPEPILRYDPKHPELYPDFFKE